MQQINFDEVACTSNNRMKLALLIAVGLHLLLLLFHVKTIHANQQQISHFVAIKLNLKKNYLKPTILSSIKSKKKINKTKKMHRLSNFTFDILNLEPKNSYKPNQVEYFNKLKAHIENTAYKYLQPLPANIFGNVTIEIILTKQGKLKSTHIVSESENQSLNKFALQLAQKISPYPVVPTELLDKDSYLHVTKVWKFAN